MKIAALYTLFAVFATIINLGAQEIFLGLYNDIYPITLSIFFGTLIGLLVKYLLDKKYIFQFNSHNIAHDSQVFFLYTSMGIITTLIFWAFEFGFEYLYHTKEMRYLGGAIGLGIGYLIKYQLDKRFVFAKTSI